MPGPQDEFSEWLHGEKYRGKGESFSEAMNRVASTLRDSDEHYHLFRETLLEQRFMPAGRVQSAVGSSRDVTPYNCFVSGTIEDSAVEGHGCIMDRAKEAFATMRKGGGIGYDFSSLRPRGSSIKKLQSQASGPVSFMEIFDAVCRCVASSGHRRGAQMGVLRIDHPDIEEFIHAKQNLHKLTGFNLSIAVTHEFMECLAAQRPFRLQWGGEIYKEIDPLLLWEMIMRSTWDWAEPGVLFIDTINEMNNLWYCEQIAATNPCGEQPLPPYGACLLGSFNLAKYIVPNNTVIEITHYPSVKSVNFNRWEFDWELFLQDIPPVVRAMDNIVDRARYPMYEQEKEAKSKRRMGLGITGLANAAEALGHSYGSPEFLRFEDEVLRNLTEGCYRASVDLAREKGAFPLFDERLYPSGKFIGTLNEEIQDLISRHGIRNSHLTSIAPTGTISLCADNVSSGIEPVFAYRANRIITEFDGPRTVEVEDYGLRHFRVEGKEAKDVSIQEHIAVLKTAYRHVDSAVSKTCNVPGTVGWEEFKQVYIDAWEGGCKGCTTFRIDGKRIAMMTVKEEDAGGDKTDITLQPAGADDGATCYVDPVTGQRDCG